MERMQTLALWLLVASWSASDLSREMLDEVGPFYYNSPILIFLVVLLARKPLSVAYPELKKKEGD